MLWCSHRNNGLQPKPFKCTSSSSSSFFLVPNKSLHVWDGLSDELSIRPLWILALGSAWCLSRMMPLSLCCRQHLTCKWLLMCFADASDRHVIDILTSHARNADVRVSLQGQLCDVWRGLWERYADVWASYRPLIGPKQLLHVDVPSVTFTELRKKMRTSSLGAISFYGLI